MRYAILALMAVVLSGCFKPDTRTIAVRQEVPIVHPENPAPPVLRNPNITIANQQDLQRMSSDPANANAFFYVLTQEEMQALLSDDADKLLLTRQLQRIVDFYKTFIDDYNRRVREENAQQSE